MNFNDLGYVRVAAACPQVHLADPDANARATLDLANELADQGVGIAVFPELGLSGYTAEDLFHTEQLLLDCRKALRQLVDANPLSLMVVGLPWRLPDGRLLNAAAAIGDGRVLGIVPKCHHPNYGEFYEKRWFDSGLHVNEVIRDPDLGQIAVRVDQRFDTRDTIVGVEICEDLWAPDPPSRRACLAGAEIVLNLSASNELIAKAEYRRDLVRLTSARQVCAYVYSSSGIWESTKDAVFGGHNLIAESGQLLAESNRFALEANFALADIDCARLRNDRSQNKTFSGAERIRPYRSQRIAATPPALNHLERRIDKHPFVPPDEDEVAARAAEIIEIQATGLARRMKAAHAEELVIGISGGLDSTVAYLVCLDALAKLGSDNKHLHALTLPGPGTTAATLASARSLATTTDAILEEISIAPAVEQHLKDLKHAGDHDVVFENAQARERTQLLFNYANKVNGIVVGTGDLSELALGWCTFNADQMASYNVNASIPKTMMAYLVRWYAQHRAPGALAKVLEDVLDTPISPELLPPEAGEIAQRTEEIVGPYELHDFFLFHFLRYGSRPEKIYRLAQIAFAGDYDDETLKHWLGRCFTRFFAQQFKRTTLPPGPKVGSVSLSPRGDWRMPDEASAASYLAALDAL